MREGKQNPRDSHQDCIWIFQCGYFLLKDAENKPKTNLHSDFYSKALEEPSQGQAIQSAEWLTLLMPKTSRLLILTKMIQQCSNKACKEI